MKVSQASRAPAGGGDAAGGVETAAAQRAAAEQERRPLGRWRSASAISSIAAATPAPARRGSGGGRPVGLEPGGVGRQDQGRDLAGRCAPPAPRGRASAATVCASRRAWHPTRHRPREAGDVGGERRVVLGVIGGMVADDIDDRRRARAAHCADWRARWRGPGQDAAASPPACPPCGHSRRPRRSPPLRTGRESRACRRPYPGGDETHLRGAGIGEADLDPRGHQRPHQAFRTRSSRSSVPAMAPRMRVLRTARRNRLYPARRARRHSGRGSAPAAVRPATDRGSASGGSVPSPAVRRRRAPRPPARAGTWSLWGPRHQRRHRRRVLRLELRPDRGRLRRHAGRHADHRGDVYLCLCCSLAEMACAVPFAGGAYGYGRLAFGPWGGFLAGLAQNTEYIFTCSVVVVAIGQFLGFILGHTLGIVVPDAVLWAAIYALFVLINVHGVRLTFQVAIELGQRPLDRGAGRVLRRRAAAVQPRPRARRAARTRRHVVAAGGARRDCLCPPLRHLVPARHRGGDAGAGGDAGSRGARCPRGCSTPSRR